MHFVYIDHCVHGACLLLVPAILNGNIHEGQISFWASKMCHNNAVQIQPAADTISHHAPCSIVHAGEAAAAGHRKMLTNQVVEVNA